MKLPVGKPLAVNPATSAHAPGTASAEARSDGGFHDTLAGIADAGAARIGDQRHFLATPQTLDDFFAPFGFVEWK